jgi:hypothetical protein
MGTVNIEKGLWFQGEIEKATSVPAWFARL